MYLANKIIAKRTHRWHSKLVLEMQCPEDAATADLRAWGVTDEDSPNSCPECFLWVSATIKRAFLWRLMLSDVDR
jgi:hypothetical protein